MELATNNIQALEIIFEAFGQVHKCYLTPNEIGAAEHLIKNICPTAIIVEGNVKVVSINQYEEKHIDKLKDWFTQINSYPHE